MFSTTAAVIGFTAVIFLLDKGAILSESEIHKREMDDDIDGRAIC